MANTNATDNVSPTALLPRWTIPSFARTAGRYPLALEAVAQDQLANVLASGLPVLSRQPRYWSIYTYIVKRFWDLGRRPQNNAALGRFLRAREVVFASAALLCQRHAELPGILGRNTLAPWLRDHRTEDLPLDLDYLDQQLGGYAQVYRGALQELEVIVGADDNPRTPLDAPHGELGAAVADAFSAAIAGTEYARRYADQDHNSIPLGVVRELAEASCFCRLTEHATERDLLTDVLLGRAQPSHPTHANRAASVRMLLSLAAATVDTPVWEGTFRQLVYYGDAEGGSVWRPSPNVEATWRRWWLIQYREFLVGALNALFVHVVRWGTRAGGLVRPLSIEQYLGEVARHQQLPPELFGPAWKAELRLTDIVSALDEYVVNDGWPLRHEARRAALSEWSLERRTERGMASSAPYSALLSVLLTIRRAAFLEREGVVGAAERAMLEDGGFVRVSCGTLTRFIEQALRRNATVFETLASLLQTFVIEQHRHIATRRLPRDIFRFVADGDGLRFINHDDAGLTPIAIRFDALASALHGLGLLQESMSDIGHAPTARGNEVLRGS